MRPPVPHRLPSSSPPDTTVPTASDTEGEQPAESGAYSLLPTVALAIADKDVRDHVSTLLQGKGRLVGSEDLVSGAAVVITDAAAGAKRTVATLRARTTSDAAIVVVLSRSAPASEQDAAYTAGAVLCLRAPLDEHHLLSAVGSAIDLRAARLHADDLTRRLDVQTHLASVGRVTAGFTHEVGNPLAALVANFEVVRENVDWLLEARELLARPTAEAQRVAQERMSRVSPADTRDALTDMGTALDRIRAVLAQARDLAQTRVSSRCNEVDLASVVRDVRRWAAEELRGVEVQEQVDQPLTALADVHLLRQIAVNLVANAAHAARQGPSPRVRLHVYESGGAAVLSVRDNGPGIPREIRDRIFEPFFTTRRGKGGTGLGLALCREYATQMRAQITVWTATGRGTCFRVHLRAPRA
jgi:signal transduction histidine kinase